MKFNSMWRLIYSFSILWVICGPSKIASGAGAYKDCLPLPAPKIGGNLLLCYSITKGNDILCANLLDYQGLTKDGKPTANGTPLPQTVQWTKFVENCTKELKGCFSNAGLTRSFGVPPPPTRASDGQCIFK